MIRWFTVVIALGACTDSAAPPPHRSAPLSITSLGVRGDPGDRLGAALARVGDLDGDGFGDLAVGLPGNASGRGIVRLVRGGPDGLAAVAPTQATLSGDTAGAAFGSSIAFLGDVDADGFGDLAVGAPEHTNPGVAEGRVYVFLGRAGGFDLTRTWTMETIVPGQRFGARVAAAGDFDGGGRSDLWVASAPATGPATISLYRGKDQSLETTPTWTTPGLTVAGAGDVDGDNLDDVVIGDPTADNNAGRCDLWLGTDSEVPPDAPARTWVGGPGEQLGASVAMAGDIDGDGLADFVCGAPGAYGGKGKLLVIFGDAAKGPIDYGGDLFVVRELGTSLAPAGDVNADGLADLIVTAGGDGDGQVLVLAGSTKHTLSVELWRGRCVDCADDHGYGSTLAPLGDIDGDGFADIGSGAPSLDEQNLLDLGALEVHRGAPTLPAQLGQPFPFGERAPGQRNGPLAVTLQGDKTGDGRDDLAIGEDGRWPPGRRELARAGLAEIYRYEPTTANFRGHLGFSGVHVDNRVGASVTWVDVGNQGYVDLMFGQPGVRPTTGFIGAATFAYFWEVFGQNDGAAMGSSVAALGDVDGDGLQDFGVGGPGERLSPTSDRVGTAVIFGTRASTPGNPPKLVAPTELWRGLGATPNAGLGTVVAAAGDVDGDTFSDVLIAAPGESKVYLLRGDPETLGPLEAIAIPTDLEHRGVALAAIGDINDDHFGDFAVGLPEAGGRGVVLLFYGSRDALRVVEHHGVAEGDRFGASVAPAGDIDDDDYADVLIGAPGVDGSFVDGGRATIYRGTATGLDPNPYWVLDGDRVGASLGDLVVGGGDLDGDTFPDFGVVARDLSPTAGSFEAARLFMFRGNGRTTSTHHPRPTQRRVAGPQAVSPYSRSNFPNAVSLAVQGASPFGSGRLRLETAITPAYASATSPSALSAWSPYLGDAVELRQTVAGLSKATAYRWRTRVHYDLVRAPPQATSRWYLGGVPGQPSQVHFRTRDNSAPVAADDAYTCASDVGLDVVAVPPNAASPGLLSNDSDADYDTLVASLPDGSATGLTDHGTVTINREGGFRYRPEPGFAGRDRFRYRASDELGGEATAEVSIIVVRADCSAAVVPSCVRGEVMGTLATSAGPRGFACRIQPNGEARELVCDHADGVLRLTAPTCN